MQGIVAASRGDERIMLATHHQDLKDLIIELLSEHPDMTAEDLRAEISLRSREYSRRAIFKELSALEELGVVLHSGRTYHLQMIWIINMNTLLRGAYLTHLQGRVAGRNRDFEGKTKLTFSNLLRLDTVWMQIMFVLQQRYPDSQFRIWKPEQWFHLLHSHITEGFMEALYHTKVAHRHIIEHDCYICRVGSRMIPRGRGEVKFSQSSLGFGSDTYITTIGEHMITVRLNRRSAEELRRRFSAIRSRKDLLASDVVDFMHGRIPSTLVVEHKPKDLAAINERFDRIFA